MTTEFADWFEKCKTVLLGQDELLFELVNNFIGRRAKQFGFYGAVLDGISGSGKTFLATVLKEQCPFEAKFFDCTRIFASSKVNGTEAELIRIFTIDDAQRPLCIFLDNSEAVFSDFQREASFENEIRISSEQISLERRVFLLTKSLIDKINRDGKRSVFLFALVTDRNALPATILRPGRLNFHFNVNSSKSCQRESLLRHFLGSWDFSTDSEKENCIKILAGQPTSGFTPVDLESLLQMTFELKGKEFSCFELNDFLKARHVINPSSIVARASTKIHYLNDQKTNMIGLEPQLESITQYMSGIFVKNEKSSSLPRGILLEGPSGCGKSLLAAQLSKISFKIAADKEVKFPVNFISVDATQIVSKYFGQSDRNLSQIFSEARRAAPCILFFDQIETLVGKRSSESSSSSSDRLVTTFLIEMDGLKSKQNSLKDSIIVLGTTSKKHLIDPAILRPGRFDLHVNFPLPSRLNRLEFIESRLKDDNGPFILSQDDIALILERTEGFSYAEMDSLFKEAAINALRADIDCERVSISNFKLIHC